MTRNMTDDRLVAIARTLLSRESREAKLAALQGEHGLTEDAARSALAFSVRRTLEGRRMYEAAEAFTSRVNKAEGNLTEATTDDLAAAIAARFA